MAEHHLERSVGLSGSQGGDGAEERGGDIYPEYDEIWIAHFNVLYRALDCPNDPVSLIRAGACF